MHQHAVTSSEDGEHCRDTQDVHAWLHVSTSEAVKEKPVKELKSYTSLPQAINWGLEQLPNITVQINHSLTRRLTHFLCIKCPLIKLPIWHNPKRQIVGFSLDVDLLLLSHSATDGMCVPIMTGREDGELAAGLSSPPRPPQKKKMLILAYITPQVRWLRNRTWRRFCDREVSWFKKTKKTIEPSHCRTLRGNEAAATGGCNPAETQLKHSLLWPFFFRFMEQSLRRIIVHMDRVELPKNNNNNNKRGTDRFTQPAKQQSPGVLSINGTFFLGF